MQIAINDFLVLFNPLFVYVFIGYKNGRTYPFMDITLIVVGRDCYFNSRLRPLFQCKIYFGGVSIRT